MCRTLTVCFWCDWIVFQPEVSCCLDENLSKKNTNLKQKCRSAGDVFNFKIHQAGQIEHPSGPVLAPGPHVWHTWPNSLMWFIFKFLLSPLGDVLLKINHRQQRCHTFDVGEKSFVHTLNDMFEFRGLFELSQPPVCDFFIDFFQNSSRDPDWTA